MKMMLSNMFDAEYESAEGKSWHHSIDDWTSKRNKQMLILQNQAYTDTQKIAFHLHVVLSHDFPKEYSSVWNLSFVIFYSIDVTFL